MQKQNNTDSQTSQQKITTIQITCDGYLSDEIQKLINKHLDQCYDIAIEVWS
jgi:hypothetical protein